MEINWPMSLLNDRRIVLLCRTHVIGLHITVHTLTINTTEAWNSPRFSRRTWRGGVDRDRGDDCMVSISLTSHKPETGEHSGRPFERLEVWVWWILYYPLHLWHFTDTTYIFVFTKLSHCWTSQQWWCWDLNSWPLVLTTEVPYLLTYLLNANYANGHIGQQWSSSTVVCSGPASGWGQTNNNLLRCGMEPCVSRRLGELCHRFSHIRQVEGSRPD